MNVLPDEQAQVLSCPLVFAEMEETPGDMTVSPAQDPIFKAFLHMLKVFFTHPFVLQHLLSGCGFFQDLGVMVD